MHPVAILFLVSCIVGIILNLFIIPPDTDTLTSMVINGIVGSLVGIVCALILD